ncbi:hypothetical protein HAX54_049058 [Datura stramonium]|uniref:(S)-2-hydroxy-acid oxidase n=1 Tax=Datura stramonium TaxID=4076 RepID=A0ABS8SUF2_DATST|nr:hypothetical protein [Datura stramonium]
MEATMAGEPVNVNEFEELARQVLPKMYYDFFAGGAEDQYTLEENIQAFRRITIRPRILVDHQWHILKEKSQQLEVLYVMLSWLGRREADVKNKMISPRLRNFEGLVSTEVVSDKGSNLEAYAAETLDPSLCWKDIAWLKSITKLPILIKGVLTGEDATKAIEAGVSGIIVSNHGARQLDYTPATISVLEEVVHAVEGKVPVLLDGGIRRGTDIFKALALGAKAVMIGRPVIYGLAAKGESGVKQVIEMLKNELELTMALAGCCTVDDITRSHVKTEKESFPCKRYV